MFVGGSVREAGDARPGEVILLDAAGVPVVFPAPSVAPANSAGTTVVSNTVSQTLLASNAARKQFIVYNNSTKTLRLTLGSANTNTTSFSAVIPAAQGYESPMDCYTGIITCAWDAVNGNAKVTEIF